MGAEKVIKTDNRAMDNVGASKPKEVRIPVLKVWKISAIAHVSKWGIDVGGAAASLAGWKHEWLLLSDGTEMGLGHAGGVPGEDGGGGHQDGLFVPVFVVDHTGRYKRASSDPASEAQRVEIRGVDFDAVKSYLVAGRYEGRWFPDPLDFVPSLKDCNDFVAEVIDRSTPHAARAPGIATGDSLPIVPNVVEYAGGRLLSPGRLTK